MKGTLAALVVAIVLGAAAVAGAESIVVTWAVVLGGPETAENRLYVFDSATPGDSTAYVTVTGLQDDYQVIHDIDFNPANGLLYGVACHTGALANPCGLYTLDPRTGAASLVGGFTSPTGYKNYIDFDPVGGQIRVLSPFGHNYRLDPATGAIAGNDTGATWAAGDPNFGTQVSTHGLAYTNSVSGATQTTAYVVNLNGKNTLRLGGIDGVPDTPAGGLLHTVGALNLPAGSFGFAYGFDISPTTGTAYAVFGFSNGTFLYTVDLSTGAGTAVGPLTGPGGATEGMAVSPTTIVLGGVIPTLDRWGVAGLIGLVLLIGAALLLARGRLLA